MAASLPVVFLKLNPSNPKKVSNAPLPNKVRYTPSECGLNSRSRFTGAIHTKQKLMLKELSSK